MIDKNRSRDSWDYQLKVKIIVDSIDWLVLGSFIMRVLLGFIGCQTVTYNRFLYAQRSHLNPQMSRSDTRWHIKYKTCLTSGTVLLIRIQMGSGVSNFVWIRIDTGIPNCRYCVLSGPKQLKIREKAGLTYNNCPSLLRTFCACHCLTWKTEIISLNNRYLGTGNKFFSSRIQKNCFV